MATATDPAPPDEAAGPQHETAPGAGVYEYVGVAQRTYLFPGSGPQTAVLGDVCALPSDPGDGNWLASKKKPTRLSDPDAAAELARRELEAHSPADSAAPAAPAQTAPAAGKGGAL
jgi:hypothetical protein